MTRTPKMLKMVGSIFLKAFARGKVTNLVTVVVALMLAMVTPVLAATGGNFILGKANAATTFSRLTANVSGPAMQIFNTNTAAGARALDLVVDAGNAPMTVNASAGKATNLDADKVDGLDSSKLSEPRGYAHVKLQGGVDTVYPSKGVNDIVIATGATSVYCFDLTFTPKTAVGSPHFNNSAVVATVTPPNAALSACPATYQDAAVKTYGSSTGTDAAINFQIVFE